MADFSTKTKLFFQSGIDGLRDPVRSTRWRVKIPTEVLKVVGKVNLANGNFAGTEDGTDNFALHVKSCKFPERVIQMQEQFYMGFGQAHVTNATLAADIPFQSILLEDMRAYEFMLAWQSMCINTGVLINEAGVDKVNQSANIRLGLGTHKDTNNNDLVGVVRNSTVAIELYNWMNGDVIARMNMVNAFPINVGGFDLAYQTASLINFPFTLHCDRWEVAVIEKYAETANDPVGRGK
jgi:hypothetical protein